MDNDHPTSKPFPPDLSADTLKEKARWIRDVLDLQVARAGPDALCSNDVLLLDELLRKLFKKPLSADELAYSRILGAVRAVAALASRWPGRLVERCEGLLGVWERVEGVTVGGGAGSVREGWWVRDVDEVDALLRGERLVVGGGGLGSAGSTTARRQGDLGFCPGDWWINGVFASRAGIIDAAALVGGSVSDHIGTYAVVLAADDEVPSLTATPDRFQYRSDPSDPGRYRLTAGSPESRGVVRILRTHTLSSPWRPRAGIRYDGLYRVAGWSVQQDLASKEGEYIITFERAASETSSMDAVLARPRADELDDWLEYDRLRRTRRQEKRLAAKIAASASSVAVLS